MPMASNMRQPRRSTKAGRPPEPLVVSPQNRRRMRTARVAVRKGTMVLETDHGPRIAWGVTKPKVKKR